MLSLRSRHLAWVGAVAAAACSPCLTSAALSHTAEDSNELKPWTAPTLPVRAVPAASATHLSPSEPQPSSWSISAANMLPKQGVMVLQQALQPASVAEIFSCLRGGVIQHLRSRRYAISEQRTRQLASELGAAVTSRTARAEGEAAGPAGAVKRLRRTELHWKQQARGRWHMQLLHSAMQAPLEAALLQRLDPLVQEVFSRRGIPCPGGVHLTELQLVVSEPGCEQQVWHADNAWPGITLLFPLHATPLHLGPTQVLPGTHALRGATTDACTQTPSQWTTLWAASSLARGGPGQPELQAGDVLVMDARTLHRGAVNSSKHTLRVALIARYDARGEHPQHAQNALGVLSARLQADFILAAARLQLSDSEKR